MIGGGFDFTGLMDKVGIKRRLKTAGSNKGMGDPYDPQTPEQQAIWEKMLADIHQEFIKAVKLGRGERISEKQKTPIFSAAASTPAMKPNKWGRLMITATSTAWRAM